MVIKNVRTVLREFFAFPKLLGRLSLFAAQYCFHFLSLTYSISNFSAAIFVKSQLTETQNLFSKIRNRLPSWRLLDLQFTESRSKFQTSFLERKKEMQKATITPSCIFSEKKTVFRTNYFLYLFPWLP